MNSPSRIKPSAITKYDALHTYSVTNHSDFWLHMLKQFLLVCTGAVPNPCEDESAPIDSVPVWFPGLRMSFAQNVLFSGDSHGRPVISPAKSNDRIPVTEVLEADRPEDICCIPCKEL
ncbi:hypothetical protein FE257_004887 [Aspergillus nanangensis]|uniref:Uncharacterized protein n=1 Tax=Aspergillus nanangensis TaxID=2582783 RepID=A0AAD4CAL1_ASPNN|nr:hypothetical protein FE257_004887 [Aspergillus nanangensis]